MSGKRASRLVLHTMSSTSCYKLNAHGLLQNMLSLSEAYNKSVQEEMTLTPEQLKTRHVGKQDPKRHLENEVEKAMGDQVGFFLSIFVSPPSVPSPRCIGFYPTISTRLLRVLIANYARLSTGPRCSLVTPLVCHPKPLAYTIHAREGGECQNL